MLDPQRAHKKLIEGGALNDPTDNGLRWHWMNDGSMAVTVRGGTTTVFTNYHNPNQED